MERTRPSSLRPATRAWSRLLDGQRVWGSVDVWPGRYGFRKYRLVVFPPGISRADRRLVRLWRGWPMWGALLWLMSEITLGNVMSPGYALVWSTVAYLAAGAGALVLAGDARIQVRSLSVVLMDGYDDPGSSEMFTEWKELVGILRAADEMVAQGKASPVDHEAAWWQVYDRLDAGRG